MSATEKALAEQLEVQQQTSIKLQQELAEIQLQSKIQLEQQKNEQWNLAIKRIKEEQQAAKAQHEQQMTNIEDLIKTTLATKPEDLDLTTTLAALIQSRGDTEKQKKEEEKKKNKELMAQLLEQQKQIALQAAELQKSSLDEESQVLLSTITTQATPKETEQQGDLQKQFIQQLKRTLGIKDTKDPQRAVLKQFLSKSNTINTPGGATTLKPNLLKQLTGEEEDFNMAEWLAMFNRQDQGELKGDIDDEGRHRSNKSGILDKATSNIQHKEVWPQKNLLEDWADEDVSFKQMQFEHHVAGEARTIELCTEPAQILGRLRLLRRMAYAKLQGYEWNLIRKMYAAILTSIEARENTWESTFDRFESILYSKQPTRQAPRDREIKKWFCRDYNRPEGCTKTSPHKAPVGAAGIIRTVTHICAACWMKGKQEKRHPEGHDTCPHRD